MKPKTWTHPKFTDLQMRLGIGPATAAGILEGIWHLVATFDEEGGTLPWGAAQLESWLRTGIEPDVLLGALIDTGWVDDSGDMLSIHDWHDHRPAYINERIRKRTARSGTVQDIPGHSGTFQENAQAASPSDSDSDSDSVSRVSTNVDTCGDPAESPPEFGFPTSHGGTWYLPTRKLDEYRDTYGDKLDVQAELRKARQWLRDNKQRRKTPGGMKAFLTRWLNKASDKVQGNGQETNEQILARLDAKLKAKKDEPR